jgi:hypothetical protein
LKSFHVDAIEIIMVTFGRLWRSLIGFPFLLLFVVFNNKFPFVLGQRLASPCPFSPPWARCDGGENNERAIGDFLLLSYFFQQYFIIYCLQNEALRGLDYESKHGNLFSLPCPGDCRGFLHCQKALNNLEKIFVQIANNNRQCDAFSVLLTHSGRWKEKTHTKHNRKSSISGESSDNHRSTHSTRRSTGGKRANER